MEPWLLEVLACAYDGCGGELVAQTGTSDEAGRLLDGVLMCSACEAPYPVLGGLPIVPPMATPWLAEFRESVLATLAEFGLASPNAVALVDTFAEPAGLVDPLRFGDDWVKDGADAIDPIGGTDQAEAFREFVYNSRDWGPDAVLSTLLGPTPLGTLVEVGCGDGRLSARLRHGADRTVVADLSLRAVATALSRLLEEPGPPVAGAVVDAEGLGLLTGTVDTLVAANVIDLLERGEAFLEGAHRALKPSGRLALCTPEPEGLHAGFRVQQSVDGVPWLRPHTERYFQVYLVEVVIAQSVRR